MCAISGLSFDKGYILKRSAACVIGVPSISQLRALDLFLQPYMFECLAAGLSSFTANALQSLEFVCVRVYHACVLLLMGYAYCRVLLHPCMDDGSKFWSNRSPATRPTGSVLSWGPQACTPNKVGISQTDITSVNIVYHQNTTREPLSLNNPQKYLEVLLIGLWVAGLGGSARVWAS